MNKIDYIIVGGGLAGITLAHQLHKRKLSFHLYYDESYSSSRVAPGLFNPITGRKMVKTWKCDKLIPYLLDFYEEAEETTGSKFLHQKTIYRPFISAEEQNDWAGKSTNKAYTPYIQEVHTKPRFPGMFSDPFGGLSLKKSGWVDTSTYIDDSIKYFKEKAPGVTIFPEKLQIDKVDVTEEGILYAGTKARSLIFSEGTGLKDNPYFNWAPLKPVKGEVIDVKLPFTIDEIFNRGVFLLPKRGNIFRVGSTYNHHDLTWEVSAEGREELTDKLRAVTDSKFEVIEHTAGIRPATKDRRPLLGRHPEFKNIVIFNGLGTKGVSLAPYFARQLVEYLEDNKDLEKDVNIQRFFSLYCT